MKYEWWNWKFLLEKAEAFALRIVRLYQHLSEKGERVMSKQVQDGQIKNLKIPPFILHASHIILAIQDADGAWRGGLRADGMLSGGENGKMCDREDERSVKRWIAITLTC